MIAVHKGNRGKYDNAKCGKYFPQNISKYKGAKLPEFKSSLEYKMMLYLDRNPNIVQWSYEPTCIKYYDKISNKVRRYFIDFIAVVKQGQFLKTVWIEIKPLCEAKAPKNKNNAKAMALWITNNCKWNAAKQIAKQKGYEFHVITENELS